MTGRAQPNIPPGTGGLSAGTYGRVYIIAEAGVNHNGDEAMALRLVDAAAAAGADAVKFQTFRAERLVTTSARTAAYQQANTGENSQFAMLRRLELSPESHIRLAARCRQAGIEFLSTPFDELSADDLVRLGMQRIKVASGEMTNLPFLRHLVRTRLPLIISTGMATLDEVEETMQAVADEYRRLGDERGAAELVTLLHCTSNYPTAPSAVNLRAMLTLRHRFGVRVGYSDHTEGILAATSAVALGACLIEKHFTLDHSLPGPDHPASLEPGELTEMVRQIRVVEQMLGSGEKKPAQSELAVRDLVRRSIVARRPIPAGAVLQAEDLELLRPGTGIPPQHLPRVIGRQIKAAIPQGAMLEWDQLV